MVSTEVPSVQKQPGNINDLLRNTQLKQEGNFNIPLWVKITIIVYLIQYFCFFYTFLKINICVSCLTWSWLLSIYMPIPHTVPACSRHLCWHKHWMFYHCYLRKNPQLLYTSTHMHYVFFRCLLFYMWGRRCHWQWYWDPKGSVDIGLIIG